MKPIVLTILDGFGYSEKKEGNAIYEAKTPNFDALLSKYPHSLLQASGEAVGLPDGQMGNSEVGHLNIGAGRIVYQPLQLINKSIKDKTFFENKEFLGVIYHVRETGGKLHLLGLLSDGGVHSHIEHFYALLKLAKQEGLKEVYIHAFLDGRDTLPDTAITYLDALSQKIKEIGIGKIVDISGRYYSMDRERMWNLTEEYYRVLVDGKGKQIKDYESYIKESYKEGVYDEFIVPALLSTDGTVDNGDGLILVNFRPDRATQLFTAITNPEFKEFPVKKLEHMKLVTMMPVEKTIITTNAFHELDVTNPLGVYLSEKKFHVLRMAEASKYPHVTYFFDGGLELELEGTDKVIIPRKNVATYDLYPAMSSYEMTDKLLEIIADYDVVILNFANCDMVGHTGNFDATVQAVEAVDENLGRIKKKVDELGGLLIVTADHGNAECMLQDGKVITSHTCNKVPFIICKKDVTVKDGNLSDIAPTMLSLMNLEIPKEMTGKRLNQ